MPVVQTFRESQPPGRTFRKSRRDVPADFFAVEAAGLRWLDAAGAVPIPAVLAVGGDFIELEHVTTAPPSAAAAAAFGRGLARLHDAGAPGFGTGPADWPGDGYIGDLTLPLRTEPTWGRSYARWRIEPYLAGSGLATDGLRTLEQLCEALEDGAFDDDAPPARLHGDLWAGNVLFTDVGVVLIDPAAQGGHRLTDLAMLALFGCSHLETILAAYAEFSVHLPPQWRRLLPLHQIHHLLIHACLFGGGYGEAAVRAAAVSLALD